MTTALRPVVWGLNGLGMLGARLMGVEPTDELAHAHTPEELGVMLDEAVAGGQLGVGEAGLLTGALGFLRVRVHEVMTPARDLVTVPATTTVAEAEALLVRSGTPGCWSPTAST
ncbi:MAG: hypothetical protein M5U19_09920 [Microthrixaceae bacterium]|nr:hypothetical protein [Microthrixaceae bacterium]